MERRDFLGMFIGALAAPAFPEFAAAQQVIPAGSTIKVLIGNIIRDEWQSPFVYLIKPGVFTFPRDFQLTQLAFQVGDDPLDAPCAIEFLINRKPLCELLSFADIPAGPLLLPVSIPIPQGLEVEFRSHGGDAWLVCQGFHLLNEGELAQIVFPAQFDDQVPIDAEFIDYEDEE